MWRFGDRLNVYTKGRGIKISVGRMGKDYCVSYNFFFRETEKDFGDKFWIGRQS